MIDIIADSRKDESCGAHRAEILYTQRKAQPRTRLQYIVFHSSSLAT